MTSKYPLPIFMADGLIGFALRYSGKRISLGKALRSAEDRDTMQISGPTAFISRLIIPEVVYKFLSEVIWLA